MRVFMLLSLGISLFSGVAFGTDGMTAPMVHVAGGEFIMGSANGHFDEAPPHLVYVSGFSIDKLETSNALFTAFVRKSKAYKIEGPWFRTSAEAALPVRFVTWRDAQAFCLAAHKRLPTEAEWEKAARGTDPTNCVLGPTNSGPDPVGSHPQCQSAFGALDMAGNVWEWVSDWYGENYYTHSGNSSNPKGPKGLANGELPLPSPKVNLLRSTLQGRESDTRKVIRGGSFGGPSNLGRDNARVSRRLYSNPNYWHPDVGFRCVYPD